jgi:exodeoxyribonuclease VII large subunit
LVAALAERARRAEAVVRRQRRERLGVATLRLQAGVRANADAHRTRIARARERMLTLSARAERAMRALLHDQVRAVERCGQLLGALSHRAVLARGFALVRDLEGRPLRTATAVTPGLRIDIEFSDARVRAQAEGAGEPAAAVPASAPKPRRGGGGGPGQGTLFEA